MDFGAVLRTPTEEVDGVCASGCTASAFGGGGGTNPGGGGLGTEPLAAAAASPSVLSTVAILDMSMSWIARRMSSLDAYWKSGNGPPNPGKSC